MQAAVESTAARSPPTLEPPGARDEITLRDALQSGDPLDETIQADADLWQAIKDAYADDPLYKKVVANPAAYANFQVKDGILYVRTRLGFDCVCIPRTRYKGRRRLTEIVLDTGHRTIGHLGPRKTNEYLRRWVWW
ncbi:hypothetical protein OH76DRAFT_1359410, partial [Lentinus brumalis]